MHSNDYKQIWSALKKGVFFFSFLFFFFFFAYLQLGFLKVGFWKLERITLHQPNGSWDSMCDPQKKCRSKYWNFSKHFKPHIFINILALAWICTQMITNNYYWYSGSEVVLLNLRKAIWAFFKIFSTWHKGQVFLLSFFHLSLITYFFTNHQKQKKKTKTKTKQKKQNKTKQKQKTNEQCNKKAYMFNKIRKNV